MITLTRDEAAEYLGCSRFTLTRMEKDGLFDRGEYYTIGNRRMYVQERLDNWILNGGEVGAKDRLKERKRAEKERSVQGKAEASAQSLRVRERSG